MFRCVQTSLLVFLLLSCLSFGSLVSAGGGHDHGHDHSNLDDAPLAGSFAVPEILYTSLQSALQARPDLSRMEFLSRSVTARNVNVSHCRDSNNVESFFHDKSLLIELLGTNTLGDTSDDEILVEFTPSLPWVCTNSPSATQWGLINFYSLARSCQSAGLQYTITLEPIYQKGDSGEIEVTGAISTLTNLAMDRSCSYYHAKIEEETSEREPLWQAWTYSMVAMFCSTVVSFGGVSLLVIGRKYQWFTLKSLMAELLALASGTFLGAVIFSILPETSLEVGTDEHTTSVILGGILFGMFGESIIHHWIVPFLVQRKGLHAHSHSGNHLHIHATKEGMNDTLSSHHNHNDNDNTNRSRDHQEMKENQDGIPLQSIGIQSNGVHDDGTTIQIQGKGSSGESTAAVNDVVELMPIHDNDKPNKSASTIDSSTKPFNDQSPIHSSTNTYSQSNTSSITNVTSSSSQSQDLTDIVQHHTKYFHLFLVNCLADSIHNFIDGALVGATFLVNSRVGWNTTIAIILHELPQEISDFAVFVEAGISPWRALMINGLVSLTGFLGAIIAIGVGTQFSHDVLKVLPFAGGLFLYLGVTYFAEVPKNWRTILAFGVGIGLMALMLLMPHEHAEPGSHEGHNH